MAKLYVQCLQTSNSETEKLELLSLPLIILDISYWCTSWLRQPVYNSWCIDQPKA